MQLTIFDNNKKFKTTVQNVISYYQKIESHDSKELPDIGEKKELLDKINDLLRPYKAVCDYHSSAYSENEISEYEYSKTISSFSGDFSWQIKPFFHWELEYPEVMLSEKVLTV